ncbi:acetylajmalan esterase-like [Apium graveolens]|uniref:acetylajmalan esterase-like n=1 Tax=Apium graveolens TaxID=4045 RepID=UPI003D795112
MASSWLFCFHVLAIASLYLLPTLATSISLNKQLPDIRSCNIYSIYQFGDSLSDTGNRKLEDPFYQCSHIPYGESFLKEPTGRCSDGLLMIDYIALAAGIPLLNPYLKASANFTHGVNFAVGSSTALSENTLAKKNITLAGGTKSSVEVQLEWMSTYFASRCKTDIDCSPGSLRNAVFMVGETGGNDYNFALQQGKTIEDARDMVPEVVDIIKDAVRRVIGFGAAQVIVPGNLPIGCLPGLLTMFKGENKSAYDDNQCLKELNDFAAFHNEYLQQAINTLQEENPTTTIVYADYYKAFKWLMYNAPHLGIDPKSALKSCCGTGGIYNYSATEGCGSPDVPVCSNPDQHISWDGFHMTQKTYSFLAQWLVADIIPKLDCIGHQDF